MIRQGFALEEMEEEWQRAGDSRRPTRILYITHNAPGDVLWGTELNLLDLIDHLDRDRYHPVAAVVQEHGAMVEALHARQVPVFGTRTPRPARLSPRALAAAFAAARSCARELDGAAPDLIHINHRWAARAGLALARRLGIPAILHLHGRPKPHHYFTDGAALASVVVANSRFTAEAWGWWPARRRLAVVYNGVRLSEFRPDPRLRAGVRRELGLREGEPVLGCVGRGTAEKGHVYLLRALASLPPARIPTTLFIGIPPVGHPAILDPHVHDIHREMARLRLQKRVRLLGFRTDVPRLLNALDLLVIPSLQESFGRVAAEAMAASLPVVATRVGGLAEVVVEGETGLLVPPADPAALAGAIAGLLAAPERRASMGENGRRRAARHFSMEAHIAGMSAVYQAALLGFPPACEIASAAASAGRAKEGSVHASHIGDYSHP